MMDGRMAAEPLVLAETLVARMCHDLSGLAGTLVNVLEMAEEEASEEVLGVAADAARTLGGRLRLLRTAWGGIGGPLDATALAELLAHAAGQPRTRTDWTECGAAPFPPAKARLLLNVALLGIELLRRGGVVRMAGDPAGPVLAVLDGLDAAWPATLTDPVITPSAEPRRVQPMLAALFARADGIGLAWDPARPEVLTVQP